VNELQQIIRAEILARGPMSCARFMELALYHQVHGYYEKRSDQVGAGGDFITNVSVGALFGRLLAFRFAQWLRELRQREPDAPLQLIEAGAHTGQLALDLLTELKRAHLDLLEGLNYLILEPSERRRQWQRETLAGFNALVTWKRGWDEVDAVRGVVFGNELLDAFPVHRRVRSGGQWREQLIDASFAWQNGPVVGNGLLPPELEAELPEGHVIECSPAAEAWWSAAAERLQAGRLVAIDYGTTEDDLVLASRRHGTLRAYRNHAVADDPLAEPGEQDLTAHVNWSAIRRAGERQGLTTIELTDQARWLTWILNDAVAADPGDWQLSPREIRQFQMLTHPQHLGRKFQAFVQSR